MRQTILSVVLEVEPQSANRLANLIDEFKRDQEQAGPAGPEGQKKESYSALKEGVPSLHFLSLSVFENANFDPIFVIEANIDGEAGPFWAQLEHTLARWLRPMLRCCKRPADDDGRTYDAVTRADSRHPLAPYLERRSRRPSVSHQGNRGLDRDRILSEGALFLATRVELAEPDPTAVNPYRGIAAEEIHKRLRAALLPKFPWLALPAPARITPIERAMDVIWLVLFAFAALACLSAPGMVVALIAPTWRFVIGLALATALVLYGLRRMQAPNAGEPIPPRPDALSITTRAILLLLAALAAYVIVATAIGAILGHLLTGLPVGLLWESTARIVVLGLLSLVFTLPAIALWLRRLERRDSSQDAPPVDGRLLVQMARNEDWIPQNHMGSVVLVKPGVLRMALFQAGHRGLHLLLRVVATDGYLGSMRTVHFAHWAFVNNSSRLMFFSNFDHSWESYLDDFIEKAHVGLTLAWGSGVGFPPTRFLILDGASHGRRFKAWARHSMAVSRVWFSAYRDYTVDQIERHARVANGLRRATLTPQEAIAWAQDL